MSRYLKRLSKIIVISFIALYFVIWLMSPVIIRHVINTYGLPQPLLLTNESSIRYNPFTAHLTISHLEIKTDTKNKTLELQSLDAELKLHQLLFDKIYVSEFSVNGIFIPVTINDTSLNIAGFELMGKNEAPEEVATTPSETNFPYEVIIPQLTLTDANIALMHFSQKHNIQLDSVTLDNILLSQSTQDINLNVVSHLNGAPIAIALNANLVKQQGQIKLDVDADNIALAPANALLPPALSALDGKVSYASKIIITMEDGQIALDVNDLLFAVKDFHIEQDGIAIGVDEQKVQAERVAVLLPADSPVSVNTVLNYSVSGISAKSINKGELLAQIADIEVSNLALAYKQAIPKVAVERVRIANSEFSKTLPDDIPALASFNELVLNNIKYEPELVAIDNITLSGLIAHLLLDKDKNIATLVTLANAKSDTDINIAEPEQLGKANEEITKAKDESSNADKANSDAINDNAELVFKLGSFTLLDQAKIDFKDSSVTPHYQRNVSIEHLSLSGIDSSKPEQEALFAMKGKSDKYANFDIKGRGLPFATQQKFNVNAVVKEVSLPGVSSYIKDALKYEIESGQLDLTIAASLTGTMLDGDVDLLLRGIELTAADDHEAGTLTDQTSVPFNIALGMLKDSDGNVELSLPLSGDTSSPSFGFSGLLTLLVKQATMSAAKDYLMTTFVPYAGVMKIAMAAGEFALKLRINDLNYLASEVELNTEQLEFSRQMSVMLADRDSVNVKLCAIATASDIDLADPSKVQQPENIARLKAISQQRVEIFKAHMVDQLKVPSSRLLFCTPQIDTSDGAKSRIKFVI